MNRYMLKYIMGIMVVKWYLEKCLSSLLSISIHFNNVILFVSV
jgi:hypothetical protein